ncbi:Glutathione S-transferase, C-terminal-like [Trema orientale]|uniref:Glutathione S-transferase, C-terminal-like n=1 Tax=Trema orientale TaxID=63057 RepID=A0A2P5BZ79_TREOI|nr:Glutathione S-transferase, C-terminal-like [Trema orientale]
MMFGGRCGPQKGEELEAEKGEFFETLKLLDAEIGNRPYFWGLDFVSRQSGPELITFSFFPLSLQDITDRTHHTPEGQMHRISIIFFLNNIVMNTMGHVNSTWCFNEDF